MPWQVLFRATLARVFAIILITISLVKRLEYPVVPHLKSSRRSANVWSKASNPYHELLHAFLPATVRVAVFSDELTKIRFGAFDRVNECDGSWPF